MPGAALYHTARFLFRLPKAVTVRVSILHPERARVRGGVIYACTHLSHMEPIAVMMTCPRHVRWLTRIEFYRRRVFAWLLHASGMIPIDRFGNSLPAVRAAIRELKRGEAIGIFPEGGVARGQDSVLRGGAIKQGVCVIARRAGVPIVPVVVLGTEQLARASAWLPIRRTRVYIAYGPEIRIPCRLTDAGPQAISSSGSAASERGIGGSRSTAPPDRSTRPFFTPIPPLFNPDQRLSNRDARERGAADLSRAFRDLSSDLLTPQISDAHMP